MVEYLDVGALSQEAAWSVGAGSRGRRGNEAWHVGVGGSVDERGSQQRP